MFNKWKSKYPDSWFSCIPGKNGFLPIKSPLKRLPKEYDIINNILDNMKITKGNGEIGLLGKNELANTINEELILYLFLGIFMIFVLDSFARASKYVR